MTHDDGHLTRAIIEAGAALVGAHPLDDALASAAGVIGIAFGVSVVELWTASSDGETLTLRARWARGKAGGGVPGDGGGAVAAAAERPLLRAALVARHAITCDAADEELARDVAASLRAAAHTSRIDVPLVDGDAALGVLVVAETRGSRDFTPPERGALTHLGQLAAAAVRDASLLRTNQEHQRHLRTLIASSRVTAASLDVDRTIEHVRGDIARVVGEACPVAMYLRASDGGWRPWTGERADGDGAPARRDAPASPPAGAPSPDPLAEQALERRRPLMARVGGDRLRIVVPLVVRDDTVGYVAVGPLTRHPDRQEIGVLQVLANNAAMVVEATRLDRAAERQTATDTATGLYNRWYFYERLYSEAARAYRYKQPLSLILTEVDAHDRFVQARGATDGNAVLRGVSRLMLKSLRNRVDVPCRLGGPLFGILLPNTKCGSPGAGLVAERLRATVEKTELRNEDHELLGTFTLTLGVAAYPLHAEDADDLAEAAEEALAAAREAGGNRTKLYASRKT